jgi:hypothetical protein
MHRAHRPRCGVTAKRCYRRAGGAWDAAWRAWERRGLHLRPYRCPWCGCWHLTSKRKHKEPTT